jgi:hemerythrin
MALMKWDATLSVGIATIDLQHQKLVALLNQLHDAMAQGKGSTVVGGVLDDLVKYTRDHFGYEEQLMQARRYPDRAAHAAEHARLTAQAVALQDSLKEGKALTMDVMQFLSEWLTGHIMGTDKRYVPFLTE